MKKETYRQITRFRKLSESTRMCFNFFPPYKNFKHDAFLNTFEKKLYYEQILPTHIEQNAKAPQSCDETEALS